MAVKVFLVEKEWEADVRACLVTDRREAQMIAFPVKEWDAQTKLFLVQRKQDADLKVFMARDVGEM